jgi:predicted Zn-dependent protease with MMP-like domain
MVTEAQREVFDAILDRQIEALPQQLHALLEEVPLIVEDEPTAELLRELGMEPDDELCGLHSGVALTERSVMPPAEMDVPDHMMLFRGPILRLSGYDMSRSGRRAHRRLEEEIHVTLLHEIGHHFGLDEDDLASLGYG